MRPGKRALLLVVAAVMAASVLTPSPTSALTAEEEAAEAQLFALINAERVEHGHKALALHNTMRAQARSHSKWMARYNKLSHRGYKKRFNRIRDADPQVGGLCENIAWTSQPAPQVVTSIYNGWLNSPPHRQCMFDQLGFSSESGGVGFKRKGNRWWATFIAGHDADPGTE